MTEIKALAYVLGWREEGAKTPGTMEKYISCELCDKGCYSCKVLKVSEIDNMQPDELKKEDFYLRQDMWVELRKGCTTLKLEIPVEISSHCKIIEFNSRKRVTH